MNLPLFLAALVGATLIVVRGTLFAPIRKLWPALLECAQCTGVWVGALGGASGAALEHNPIVDAIIFGAATSFLATLADAILLRLLGDPNE